VTRANSRLVRADGFADFAAADAWLREKNARRQNEDPVRPQLRNVVRRGDDFRNGKDVSEEDLLNTFGLRGVQFGNWTNQADRQQSINHAYDALMDLANVLDIPAAAVGLGGRMGLAFGARGHGGRNAAHYEPVQRAINLTKMSGAGALAHEWAHALDDYLGSESGDVGGRFYVSGGTTTGSRLRPEVQQAISGVMSAIRRRQATGDEQATRTARIIREAEHQIRQLVRPMREEMMAGRKRPASREELYAFDSTTEAVAAGRGGRHELDQLHQLYRDVTGRLPAKNTRDQLEAWTVSKQQAALGGQEPRALRGTRKTEFLAEAEKLDARRSKKYWSTPHEMFARALESWVYDEIAEGGRSDYLVHSVDEFNAAYAGAKGYPYPRGEERATIRAAFRRMAEVMQSQPVETESGREVQTLFQQADPVNSPEFQAWFGDSKVVDEDGQPMVVYRGGPPRDVYGPMETAEMVERETGLKLSEAEREVIERPAWWTSPDPTVALSYAEKYAADDAVLTPLYLRIENPIDLTDAETFSRWYGRPMRKEREAVNGENLMGVIRRARAAGFDGVIHYDTDQYNREADEPSYVFFAPTQAKLAPSDVGSRYWDYSVRTEGNRGTFDPGNPSILFQGEPEIEDLTPEAAEAMARLEAMPKTRVEKLGSMASAAIDGVWNFIGRPANVTERRHGRDVRAAINLLPGTAEAGAVKWENTTLTELGAEAADLADYTLAQLGRHIEDAFSPDEQRDILLSVGTPATPLGQALQKEAMGRLTAEQKKILDVLRPIYDFNFKILRKVGPPGARYFKDYFRGAWEDSERGREFFRHYQTTDAYIKHKLIPTVADGMAAGVRLRDANPVGNARREAAAIFRYAAMSQLLDTLRAMDSAAEKVMIVQQEAATPHQINTWRKVQDPQFDEYLVEPAIARHVNNLIAVNRTGATKAARAFRSAVHFLQGLKFLWPLFHMRTIIAQSYVDSGLLGIINPLSVAKTTRQLTGSAFRQDDPIFQSPAYLDYVRHGGSHKGSLEQEARGTLERILTGRDLPLWWRLARTPLRLFSAPSRKFNTWVFEQWIPGIKFAKYLQEVQAEQKRLGRTLTPAEKQTIINVGQNFYGEINEKLFGRSATMTSALRFVFLAPGFREGNYGTMARALAVGWDAAGGPAGRDWRSVRNIPQYLLFTAMAAAVGTRILTGRWPDWPPEDEDELRDLFKVKTPWADDKGRTLYIDLMTTDKDYFEQIVRPAWQAASGRPAEAAVTAADTAKRTIGGMIGPVADMGIDTAIIMRGGVLVDWKGDRVYHVTDSGLQKLNKLLMHHAAKAEPIPISSARQAGKKGLGSMAAFLITVTGARVGISGPDRREAEVWGSLYSLRSQREELHRYIRKAQVRQAEIDRYNETVDGMLEYPKLTQAQAQYLRGLYVRARGID